MIGRGDGGSLVNPAIGSLNFDMGQSGGIANLMNMYAANVCISTFSPLELNSMGIQANLFNKIGDRYDLSGDGTVSLTKETSDKFNTFYGPDGNLVMQLGTILNEASFGKGYGPKVAWDIVHTSLGLNKTDFEYMSMRASKTLAIVSVR